MKDITKQYTNGEVTIVWKPDMCIHSRICWRRDTGLPEVFAPQERPWIRPEGASTERIIEQVAKCPSGALSYFHNDAGAEPEVTADTRIEVSPNGPLLVYGNIVIRDGNGGEIRRSKVTAFCRCGLSANKPYCDGSHIAGAFQG